MTFVLVIFRLSSFSSKKNVLLEAWRELSADLRAKSTTFRGSLIEKSLFLGPKQRPPKQLEK